jgi:hypothetical protein
VTAKVGERTTLRLRQVQQSSSTAVVHLDACLVNPQDVYLQSDCYLEQYLAAITSKRAALAAVQQEQYTAAGTAKWRGLQATSVPGAERRQNTGGLQLWTI